MQSSFGGMGYMSVLVIYFKVVCTHGKWVSVQEYKENSIHFD